MSYLAFFQLNFPISKIGLIIGLLKMLRWNELMSIMKSKPYWTISHVVHRKYYVKRWSFHLLMTPYSTTRSIPLTSFPNTSQICALLLSPSGMLGLEARQFLPDACSIFLTAVFDTACSHPPTTRGIIRQSHDIISILLTSLQGEGRSKPMGPQAPLLCSSRLITSRAPPITMS